MVIYTYSIFYDAQKQTTVLWKFCFYYFKTLINPVFRWNLIKTPKTTFWFIYSALNSTFGTVLFHLKGTSFLNENRWFITWDDDNVLNRVSKISRAPGANRPSWTGALGVRPGADHEPVINQNRGVRRICCVL